MVATAMAALEKAWHIFPPGGNIGLHLFQVLRVPLSLRPLERIPVMFERSRRDERSFCILWR
jgi:hypothetical protein